MFVKIYAPADGEIKEINSSVDDVVNPDTVIMTLE